MSPAERHALDRRLLGPIQLRFPLERHPYRRLAEDLDTVEREVLAAIARLKEDGLVRQISPVVDARRLGYQSTLVAAEVPEAGLARAESELVDHPGISHAYVRDHKFNLWFTLSLPGGDNVEAEVQRLGSRMGALVAFSLPALKLFKIGAFFGAEGVAEVAGDGKGQEIPQQVTLSAAERAVINVLQQDLPLASAPFDRMAEEAGMTTVEMLACCQSLIDRRVMRRYGASVNHRRVGLAGNGMACWNVPAASVERVGQQVAAIEAVSHCYERRTNPDWPYNLFAMFHGATPDRCRQTVADASGRLGLADHLVLFSTREIKKTRVRYRV
jgi:DNA-binding Lrp family transcriptional regulator